MDLSKQSENIGKGVINLVLTCPRYILKTFFGKLTLSTLSCPSYIVRGKILDATSVLAFLCCSV